MPSKRNPLVVLYPEYFDSKLTRLQGRRVAKENAVPAPTVEDVVSATREAGFKPVMEKTAAYPKQWWGKRGRVLVKPIKPKTEIIRKVAAHMREGVSKK